MDRSADNLGQVISGIQRDLEELKSSQGSGSGGGGGGGGEEYYAGDGITISNNTISADTNVLATKTDLTDYAELSDLATVATSGNYNDLTNKPTIPAAQVNSDWSASSGVAEILNKPNLATVATSGSYNDLSNKPTIPTVNNGILTIQKNGTTVQTFAANQSTAATANISVPTKTSDLANDAGFVSYSGNICGSGKSISLSAPFNEPLASFQLDGETSQNGTPTPSAPVPVQTVTGENVVKICGKNLLGLTSAANITSSGVSSTWDGSHLAFSGTATSNQVLLSQYIANNFPAGNYTLSLASPAASRTIFRFFDSNNSTLKSFTIEAGSSSVAVTLDGTEAKFRFVMLANPGTEYNRSCDIQLELGSTATAYEPYQGQSYEVNLGKNLFNKDSGQVVNAYFDNSKISTGNSFRTAYISCEPNTTYTVSKMQSSRFAVATTTDLPANNVATSGFTQNNTATSITITTGAAAKYIVVFLYHAAYDTTLTPEQILATLQIEKGSQATSYAAYFEPIELCKIGDYQDYIWNDNGTWKIHKAVGKVILDGVNKSFSDRFTTVSSHYRFVYTDQSIPNYTSGTVAQIYCNRLIGGTIGNTYNRIERIAYNDANHRLISYISSIEDSTLAAANTWLQSNPLDIVYILATPTDTEITNSALVAQLNALLTTARTYAGINNIFTITPNEQGTLEFCFEGGVASAQLMGGCTSTTNGFPGLVPAPSAGDQEKYLRSDGTWQPAGSSSSIPDGAVTTPKLADSAVTTIKVNDGAIITAKLASKAVTTAKIDDGAVTNAQIANSTIAATKMNWSTFKYNFTATTDGAGFIVVPTDVVNKTTGFILSARCPGSRYAFALVFSDADTNNNRYTLCIKSWDMSNITNQSVEVDILYCLA